MKKIEKNGKNEESDIISKKAIQNMMQNVMVMYQKRMYCFIINEGVHKEIMMDARSTISTTKSSIILGNSVV